MHDPHPPNVLTVAGYLTEDSQVSIMDRKIVAECLRLGLSHFSQCDCAQGAKEYDGWSIEKRLDAQKILLSIIHEHTIFGSAVSINIDDYFDIVGGSRDVPTPYAFAMIGGMNIVRNWIDRTDFRGDIAYILENGYKDQGNGRKFIDYLLRAEGNQADYHIVSFAHSSKKKVRPLQAEDMLAWYSNQEFSRYNKGNPIRRKDFDALLRPQDMHTLHNPQSLMEFREVLDKHGPI